MATFTGEVSDTVGAWLDGGGDAAESTVIIVAIRRHAGGVDMKSM